ncbi:RNA dependent RNA polymerase-domain-containing protein [Hygrophoropsis aurantiaca]|uniref:RNA dependent RNA polymerase-domain-containing protein n=1 Tax=Hygrophoropsis aurantiaca TaxID=72124 RepID=A0ACB8AE26_9AGAM|nr:RNA dependent RNA polymerase-domain-containing protein [Hygrophoropsis aurantiaca]
MRDSTSVAPRVRKTTVNIPSQPQRASQHEPIPHAGIKRPRPPPQIRNVDDMEIDEVEKLITTDDDEDAGTRPWTRTASVLSIRAVSPRPTKSHTGLKYSATVPLSSSTRSSQSQQPDFGSALAPVIICHSTEIQSHIDAKKIAWGTVYELARGVSKGLWSWNDVTPARLDQLKGTNAETARKVPSIIASRSFTSSSDVWIEYDREQAAIMENKGRGLGAMGEWHGKDNWYGGRIQQVVRLLKNGSGFIFELEKPEIRRSHRFSRFLGSRRVLQVRISEDLMLRSGEEVRTFLHRSKFVLCGRVFLPFHAKEGALYMMETNENYGRTMDFLQGDHFRISLSAFVQWHNPLRLNSKQASQPISKWSTRWALGASTSVPTIEFMPENIHYIEDEYAPYDRSKGKAPAEKIMTDGCGFINGAALTRIMRLMKYPTRPTALQGRIAGSKGLYLLHPDPLEQIADGPAKIWIRDSQNKINLGSVQQFDRAHRIFDLLSPSRVTSPSRLSSQTLTNLSYNGVPDNVLKLLMASGLREEISQLMQWTGENAMICVWRAVEKAGHVVFTRLRRRIAGQSRALGLGRLLRREELGDGVENEDEDNEIEDNNNRASDVPSSNVISSSERNKYSGQPITIHETVMELLQCGFHPNHLEILFMKLEKIVSLVLDGYIDKFHIPVAESVEAYIVPDPFGVLEEGEIHFRSSEVLNDPTTGAQFDTVEGPVLVSRNPTRLPSDIQKVKGVQHPRLSQYYDVIVFSTKGPRSLASWLGGGDYDGDTVTVSWAKDIVKHFKNSSFSEAPGDISEAFERQVEQVKDFDKRVSILPNERAQEEFQKVLLLGLAETKVGLYSNFHDIAVYEHGYSSAIAIRLAYMFTTCLDASKTGLRVKLDVFANHQKAFGSKFLRYKSSDKYADSDTKIPARRNRVLGPYILDALRAEGERLRVELLREYNQKSSFISRGEDKQLIAPFRAAEVRAQSCTSQGFNGFTENLKTIKDHVRLVYDDWQEVNGKKRAPAKKRGRGADSGATSADDLYLEVARKFAEGPCFEGVVFFSDEDIKAIKAAYASVLSTRFAFSVAFSDLCAIKAKSSRTITFIEAFAGTMSIPTAVFRALSQTQDGD